MSIISDIQEATRDFFAKHWNETLGDTPFWIGDWKWNGPLPYSTQSGVYALIDDKGEILYIGVGTSRGGGRYVEHGLSRRLVGHVVTKNKDPENKNQYKPKEKWSEIDSIATIGFPQEFSYLALALEDYLIGKFNPPRNSSKKTA